MWQKFRSRPARRSSSNPGGLRGLTRALALPAAGVEQRPEARRAVADAELQQDVQRAASGFMDRVAQARDPLVQDGGQALDEALLRRILLYEASVLDIATGPL